MISKELLEILACPACGNPVVENGDWVVCSDRLCGLQYPIQDEIPVMLVEKAKKS